MAGDGNCLFRSVAHQVYGDPELHQLVREKCAKYMVSSNAILLYPLLACNAVTLCGCLCNVQPSKAVLFVSVAWRCNSEARVGGCVLFSQLLLLFICGFMPLLCSFLPCTSSRTLAHHARRSLPLSSPAGSPCCCWHHNCFALQLSSRFITSICCQSANCCPPHHNDTVPLLLSLFSANSLQHVSISSVTTDNQFCGFVFLSSTLFSFCPSFFASPLRACLVQTSVHAFVGIHPLFC